MITKPLTPKQQKELIDQLIYASLESHGHMAYATGYLQGMLLRLLQEQPLIHQIKILQNIQNTTQKLKQGKL